MMYVPPPRKARKSRARPWAASCCLKQNGYLVIFGLVRCTSTRSDETWSSGALGCGQNNYFLISAHTAESACLGVLAESSMLYPSSSFQDICTRFVRAVLGVAVVGIELWTLVHIHGGRTLAHVCLQIRPTGMRKTSGFESADIIFAALFGPTIASWQLERVARGATLSLS